MPNRPEVLDHLGPYTRHSPIAACCELSERVWRTYNELTAGYIHCNQNSREYLILRMLYIAEITSTAIRLNATWALTPAAMSQFSSVSHYDRFSIEFFGLHESPDGKLVLGTRQQWPALLLLRNADFDIIQCFEAAHVCHQKDAPEIFEKFLALLCES